MWANGWQSETLRVAGIPCTLPALTALSAWQRSTPTQSWSNNPLGLPTSGKYKNAVPLTNYAIFPTMGDFRSEFKHFLASRQGSAIKDALMQEASYSVIWRAIDSAGLPGSKTESEYPAELLNLVESKYARAIEPNLGSHKRSSGTAQGRVFDKSLQSRLTQAASADIRSARSYRRGK